MADSKTKNTAKHETIKDVPIGIDATGQRQEFDSMGAVEVPADRYWGAQTQRSLQHFSIGDDHMPKAVYHAYGYVKKAAALVNAKSGRLRAMARRCDHPGGRRGDRRQARRTLPALRLADGVRHAVQHEPQRGDLQPRHPAARRHARHTDPDPPQRPRQHGPVVQRQLPDRDAHRDGARAHRAHAARAGPLRHRDRSQGEPMDGRRQNRPHPSAGRSAAHGRPRMVGLRRRRCATQWRTCAGRWTGCTASRAAAPRSAPGSTRRTASRSISPK